MSLPTFPSTGDTSKITAIALKIPSPGAGNDLPVWLLALCGAFTAVATGVSIMSITLQLKNYRKPSLQRAVVRIMVMVPLYAISSLIALFSLEAAFFIDAVRDLYEAFVIYTFFQLLITYLGGERSLLIILHGRPPIAHPFPVGLFLRPMDVSDPWTLLNLKRGVLQYVQIKPLLVIATVVLKLTGTYREGRFSVDSGYTYVSIVYNTSICLSLYCLAMFWACVSTDLRPFRPVPKFLCVKGILFFSFWQGIAISLLVAVHAIKKVGVYTDAEHMSLALVDSMVCFEMPIFAIAHQYAFRASDYIDESLVHAARLPFIYALRDSFGLKDVWEDSKDTLRGRGVSYQAYEPAEGGLHQGAGRQKRIRAGLRYSKGGKTKYWLPTPGDEARGRGNVGPFQTIKKRIGERLAAAEGYAPLLPEQAERIVHEDMDGMEERHRVEWGGIFEEGSDESDAPSLEWGSVDGDEEGMYERARRIGYAGFPNVDVSKEEKRRAVWEEEEGILQGRWNRRVEQGKAERVKGGKEGGKGKSKGKMGVYGAWADRISSVDGSPSSTKGRRPSNPNGDGDWLYDGDNERSDTWKAENGHKDASVLHWTKKQLHLAPPTPKEERPKSPFALGDDEPESSNSPPLRNGASSPLPPDAVDLVVEDPKAVEDARIRARQRGEPQNKVPSHIYKHQDAETHKPVEDEIDEVTTPGVNGEVQVSAEVDEVPLGDAIDRIEQFEHIVEAPTPPVDRYRMRQDDNEDNPWA